MRGGGLLRPPRCVTERRGCLLMFGYHVSFLLLDGRVLAHTHRGGRHLHRVQNEKKAHT